MNPYSDSTGDVVYESSGLTKREIFAAMAMQGILAASPFTIEAKASIFAYNARTLADALIKELEKKR